MLPQKPAPGWRKFNLRRYIAWFGLPFLGVVAAFGAIPQAGNNPAKLKTVVEEVSLPQPAATISSTSFWRNDRVQSGDTIADLLRRLNVEDEAAEKFLRTGKTAVSLRQLTPGRSIQAETTANGNLLTLRYLTNNGDQILLEKRDQNFVVRTLPARLEKRLFIRTGIVKTNLFDATDEANLPEPVVNQLAEIFGSSIDFYHDIKPGDRFSIIYETAYSNGDPVYTGRILAADFVNRGRLYRALYYRANGEHGDYFSPEGRSLRRPFLRSPVEFSRISSGYSTSRLHPILHKWGAHKGIDFAAPEGTKVRATAAGKIAFVGEQRGYGKLVIIRHQGSYSTAYGHLSRFPAGLHTGQAIAQNETIGYVGMTGLATGPHLHYEFRVNDQPRNPMTAAPADAPSIPNEQREVFLGAIHDLQARLEMLHKVNLAQAN